MIESLLALGDRSNVDDKAASNQASSTQRAVFARDLDALNPTLNPCSVCVCSSQIDRLALSDSQLDRFGEMDHPPPQLVLSERAPSMYQRWVSLQAATELLWAKCAPIAGICILAFSAFLFSVMSLCVSLAGVSMPSWQLVWHRSMIQALCAFIAIWKTKPNDLSALIGPPGKRRWVLMRGITGIIGMNFYYLAVVCVMQILLLARLIQLQSSD